MFGNPPCLMCTVQLRQRAFLWQNEVHSDAFYEQLFGQVLRFNVKSTMRLSEKKLTFFIGACVRKRNSINSIYLKEHANEETSIFELNSFFE